MPEPYISDLFVGREEPLRRILVWANDPNPSHRLRSVIGSPGIGKSFLLSKTFEQLAMDSQQLVLWMNASGDPLIRQGPDVRGLEGLLLWLKEAIEKARQKCNRVRPYQDAVPPETMLDALVTDLCDKCSDGLRPILIVDSFDELEEQGVFEERVLAPFLGRSCTRILLSRRDQYGLTSPTLRWNEYPDQLPVMTTSEGKEQVDRRIERRQSAPHLQPVAPPPADLLEHLKAIVPEYAWNHPGINTFLIERAIQRQRQQLSVSLSAEDFRECIVEVTRARDPLSPSAFALLTELATHPALVKAGEWTELDLSQTLNTNLEDERLGELFTRGIVFHVEGTGRYKVGDGLGEVLRARQRMRAANSLQGETGG